MHLLHITAVYKLGHQRLVVLTAVMAKNINCIEKVPEEAPEYSDGTVARVVTVFGERIPVKDDYATLVAEWESLLKDLE